MKTIQIVGYKNSGKTTIASNIITFLSTKGLRVASIKHHGHGGVPEGLEHTDSEKHKQAGALFSGVEGNGLLQLSKDNWTLDEILELYRIMNIDITVIEGFKIYSYPKVVLIRKHADLSLLEKAENVKAVISSITFQEEIYSFPVFHPTNMRSFLKWLEGQLN